MKNRFIIGILFLGLQVALVVYARFIPERFFCWAPYDIHTKYIVKVTIDGQLLSNEETRLRYRYKPEGWEQRSIFNIISQIEQYETTYGKSDKAHVEVVYSINGKPEETWTLKQ